jgi:putative addiction module component (TIGR02574 family)
MFVYDQTKGMATVGGHPMSELLVELSQRATDLSPEERAQFAERLLESLEGDSLPEIEAAWAAEVQARIAAIERGEARTIAAEDVFAEAGRLCQ